MQKIYQLIRKLIIRLFDEILLDPMRTVEAESREYLASGKAKDLDVRVIVVLVTSAIVLTLLEYVGMSNEYGTIVNLLDKVGLDNWAQGLNAAMTDPENVRINRLTYWAAGCFISYFVIPALVIKLVFKENLSDYGLRIKGAFHDYWIYVFMFAVVGPLVYIVSANEHFQHTYPFYDLMPGESLWPNLWRWELMYFTQFFALEFFFRGFIIHGTRHRLGYYAVYAMMVPYCMIHFGKPMPETFGAIIAGIALGSLSLKTRSIWLGVAIHSSVALSMDFASLWRKGMLF